MADSLIETSSSSSSDTVSTSSNTGVVVVGGDLVVGSGINSVNSAIPILPVDIQVDTTSNTRPLPPIVDEPILMMINSVNGEPESKRKKFNTSQESKSSPSMSSSQAANANFNKNLEDRLGGIICCAVCLDLPKFSMYQCQLGHLMCAACFTHLLADAKLRNLNATCPNCRIDLSRATASRNLAVEKIVSELQSECQYCAKEMIHKMVSRHEKECDRRPTKCGFARIGCDWKGPINEAKEHEAKCVHPQKSGAEVMTALKAGDAVIKKDQKILKTLIELLSYEQIIFNDLQMKPFRTDEYIHKLFYETKEFEAFHNSWIVTGRINNSQRDPHTVNDRNISYQLVLKSKTTTPLTVNFIALKGPFSDIKITTDIYKHEFTNDANESQYFCLPLPNSFECNRLLAAKAINFRFQWTVVKGWGTIDERHKIIRQIYFFLNQIVYRFNK